MADGYRSIRRGAAPSAVTPAERRLLWERASGFGFAQSPADVRTYGGGWWMERGSQLESRECRWLLLPANGAGLTCDANEYLCI